MFGHSFPTFDGCIIETSGCNALIVVFVFVVADAVAVADVADVADAIWCLGELIINLKCIQ